MRERTFDEAPREEERGRGPANEAPTSLGNEGGGGRGRTTDLVPPDGEDKADTGVVLSL